MHTSISDHDKCQISDDTERWSGTFMGEWITGIWTMHVNPLKKILIALMN